MGKRLWIVVRASVESSPEVPLFTANDKFGHLEMTGPWNAEPLKLEQELSKLAILTWHVLCQTSRLSISAEQTSFTFAMAVGHA